MENEFTKLLILIAAQGAIGMAAVAGLRATLSGLSAISSMLLAFAVSLITCASWELYIGSTGQVSQWETLPIKVLVVGLISMGWWSGTKAATGHS